MFPTIAFLTGAPGWLEIVVVAVLGLLLFGRRFPDVARALGQSLVEFKRGLRTTDEQFDQQGLPADKLSECGNGTKRNTCHDR
ncbi:MAG: twin-arginine translocase TatA/TatE family subunit [Phycisphaerales bacterium]|nr:twin-arginine translocase TatA/TatE family subunit [Phycisphaerales bacterium]